MDWTQKRPISKTWTLTGNEQEPGGGGGEISDILNKYKES